MTRGQGALSLPPPAPKRDSAMHAARLDASDRLQRVHDVLADGAEHSTREIIFRAGVCAVNSCISELRRNGAVIKCDQVRSSQGKPMWVYRMTTPARSAT